MTKSVVRTDFPIVCHLQPLSLNDKALPQINTLLPPKLRDEVRLIKAEGMPTNEVETGSLRRERELSSRWGYKRAARFFRWNRCGIGKARTGTMSVSNHAWFGADTNSKPTIGWCGRHQGLSPLAKSNKPASNPSRCSCSAADKAREWKGLEAWCCHCSRACACRTAKSPCAADTRRS